MNEIERSYISPEYCMSNAIKQLLLFCLIMKKKTNVHITLPFFSVSRVPTKKSLNISQIATNGKCVNERQWVAKNLKNSGLVQKIHCFPSFYCVPNISWPLFNLIWKNFMLYWDFGRIFCTNFFFQT